MDSTEQDTEDVREKEKKGLWGLVGCVGEIRLTGFNLSW